MAGVGERAQVSTSPIGPPLIARSLLANDRTPRAKGLQAEIAEGSLALLRDFQPVVRFTAARPQSTPSLMG